VFVGLARPEALSIETEGRIFREIRFFLKISFDAEAENQAGCSKVACVGQNDPVRSSRPYTFVADLWGQPPANAMGCYKVGQMEPTDVTIEITSLQGFSYSETWKNGKRLFGKKAADAQKYIANMTDVLFLVTGVFFFVAVILTIRS